MAWFPLISWENLLEELEFNDKKLVMSETGNEMQMEGAGFCKPLNGNMMVYTSRNRYYLFGESI